jgi:hypothetical protein
MRAVEPAVVHVPGIAASAVGLGDDAALLDGGGVCAPVGEAVPSEIREPHPTTRAIASRPAGRATSLSIGACYGRLRLVTVMTMTETYGNKSLSPVPSLICLVLNAT